MKLWLLGVSMALLVLIGGFFVFNSYIYEKKQAPAAEDYKSATYSIDGKPVQLADLPAEAGVVRTRYFGNEVTTDLNADGREDIVFLITQEGGGSGTFFYAVAALNTERGYVGSSGFLLGDRIAPQTTEVSKNPSHRGVVVVNYADRAAGEPMTERPSVGKSVWLKLDVPSMQFGEVEQNFTGEADPSRMALGMKTWSWVASQYSDGRLVTPKQEGRFTLTFEADGRVSVTTDCNRMAATYTALSNDINFSGIVSTKMYCEGSQEAEFAQMLEAVSGYHFTSRGELVLDLKFDSGSVIFR